MAKDKFELEVKDVEIREYFGLILLSWCNVSEAEDICSVRHGGRRPQRSSSHSTRGGRMSGRKGSKSVVAEATDKRTTVVEPQAEAASLTGRDRSTRKQETQSEIGALLSQQSSVEWPSVFETMCGSDGAEPGDPYSTFTFESLHKLHLGVSRILKLYLVQQFSS